MTSDVLAVLAAGSHTEPAPYDYLVGDCQIWDGETTRKGYGRVDLVDLGYRAVHRAAQEARYGPIPAGMCVLHRCDRPACWADQHLWVGTHQQNMADMVAKGREPAWLTARMAKPHRPLYTDRCRRGHPLVDGRLCRHGKHCAPATRILTAAAPLTAVHRDYVLGEWDAGRVVTRAQICAQFPDKAPYAAKTLRKLTRMRAVLDEIRAELAEDEFPLPHTPSQAANAAEPLSAGDRG